MYLFADKIKKSFLACFAHGCGTRVSTTVKCHLDIPLEKDMRFCRIFLVKLITLMWVVFFDPVIPFLAFATLNRKSMLQTLCSSMHLRLVIGNTETPSLRLSSNMVSLLDGYDIREIAIKTGAHNTLNSSAPVL
jgi:hypothetical protein